MIEAVQHQVTWQFRSHWGSNCNIALYPSAPPKQRFVWPCYLQQHADVSGAGGYHDDDTQIELKVFVDDLMKYGYSWTVASSHEILEALADPQASRAVQVGNSTFWALEVCDACEADEFGYGIKVRSGATVQVSDFVKPSWFGAPATDVTAPYDYKGHITKPLQLLAGGYIGEWTPTHGWSQKVADSTAQRSHRIAARAVRWGQSTTSSPATDQVFQYSIAPIGYSITPK